KTFNSSWAQVFSDQAQGSTKTHRDFIERFDLNINGIESFLEKHIKTKIMIPVEIKQQVNDYFQSSVFELKTFDLFEKGFSPFTQNRFKQVSKSVVDTINRFDQNMLRSLSTELMQLSSLQRRVYSLYIAYMLLEYSQEWSKESQTMMYSLMNDSFFEGREYLKLRFLERGELYLNTIKEALNSNESNKRTHSIPSSIIQMLTIDDILLDLGFWLRRDLDQSRVSLFHLIKLAVQSHAVDSITSLPPPPPSQSGLSTQILNIVYEPILKRSHFNSKIYLGDLQGLLTIEGLNQGIKRALNNEKIATQPSDSKSNAEQQGLGQEVKLDRIDRLNSKALWEMFSMQKLEKAMNASERKRPFLFLNPRFIFWINDHIIPNSRTKLLLSKLRKRYEQRYKRLGTLMYKSRVYLKSKSNLNEEKLNYSLARFSAKFDEDSYLQQRYAHVLTQEFPEKGTNTFTPAKAIGFWLRREIDGSAEFVWSSLLLFLSQLDLNFDKSLKLD
ncbi:MAG: hypothetical protein CMH49_00510, partial [Myxococcales bacterium]|nr:hypothetical protein [Myxococcales bacterium]